ncbi:CAP domain-containing protein [Actinoplanes awajinensis]|uniref:SCP-like extracellular n=1 Tax=Actinoplanes awajinensis subsp. mycoplanecinus TaxID=135947 RepID=A0A101JKT3_9ACTN|nr:CAP domain-containing protein [Actinoplanes awajinensis]KUL28678.1 SCP-like extracellular [Actinoplanes awajinensis subsp. mycoplanecinus]
MRSLFRRFALVAALAPAAALGVTLVAAPAQAAPVTETTMQADIVRLTNVQRTAHGCAALKVDERLITAARGHSAYMGQTGSFSHTGKGGSNFVAREKAAGYPKPSAENIAWGYRSGKDVVSAWMKSPGHRANILSCKSKTVGVGAVYSDNGTPYFTQDFGY